MRRSTNYIIGVYMRFWLGALAVSMAFTFNSFAQDTLPANPQPPAGSSIDNKAPEKMVEKKEKKPPRSMVETDCKEILTTWFHSANPLTAEQIAASQRATFKQRQKTKARERAQGTLARRSFAEGTMILERLLSELCGTVEAGTIRDNFSEYLHPAFDAAVLVMNKAKAIHEFKGDPKSDALKNLKTEYFAASKDMGFAYSRYVMIMDTLVSIANGEGLLNIEAFQKLDPERSIKEGTFQIVYDLKSEHTRERARSVLALFDYQAQHKGLEGLPVNLDDKEAIPYPALNVVQEIFKLNYSVQEANAEWDWQQQKFLSKPVVWLAQFLSDASVGLTSGIPVPWIRSTIRFIVDWGNKKSIEDRYFPRLLRDVGITRAVNGDGNLVITNDFYYLNLQMKQLFKKSDDELEALARTLWFREVWVAVVEQLAKEANVKVSSKWAPKGLADPDAIKPKDDITSFARQAITPVAPPPSDDKGKKDSSTDKKTDPTSAGTNSQLMAIQLQRFLEIERRAGDKTALDFPEPRSLRTMARLAVVQFSNLNGAIMLYESWPWLTTHIYSPVATEFTAFMSFSGQVIKHMTGVGP